MQGVRSAGPLRHTERKNKNCWIKNGPEGMKSHFTSVIQKKKSIKSESPFVNMGVYLPPSFT